MKIAEKLGEFYLGKVVDPATKKTTDKPLCLESKDLTTHVVIVGMTGSGKTGLALDLIEEAGLDKIPAILIDPKGDLADLLLTFPNLSAEEFLPWIDKGEAEKNGMDPKAYSEVIAKKWQSGLKEWGEDKERIKTLRDNVELAIYTPASQAGLSLSILSSFAAPPKEVLLDQEAFRDRILSTVSSLLGLLGLQADPIKSREHILISTILEQAWSKGVDLDIPTIIQQVQTPPFHKVGVLDIDTFFPSKERTALSINLNNLLASPGFQAWMEGEPLHIENLLYTKSGKPKLSILSIAHLSDAERMFFVTLLLNEYVSWMRRQPGTSSLKTVLYMDEVYGFFPPIATPPSKKPMLTLLKQARAFGVGIVLATQNPADLDYKGLANCGAWFIGKLQTDRDKARVLEGLQVASNGEIDTKTLDKMVASTGNRTFILRSIHEKEPILFQTRWTLSYLRGPLTLTEIASLTKKDPTIASKKVVAEKQPSKPSIPQGINEYYINKDGASYKPFLLGKAKLHFVDAKNKIDNWVDVSLLYPVTEEGVEWEHGTPVQSIEKDPKQGKVFEDLPSPLNQAKNWPLFAKVFASTLFQNQTYTLFQANGLTSKANETEADFRKRWAKQIEDSYGSKISSLKEKMGKVSDKASELEKKANMETASTLISFGTTLLGALFSKKLTKGTLSQAGSAFKKVGKVSKGSSDADKASENLKSYEQQLNDLQAEMEAEIEKTKTSQLQTNEIHPRKSDIAIEQVALTWVG